MSQEFYVKIVSKNIYLHERKVIQVISINKLKIESSLFINYFTWGFVVHSSFANWGKSHVFFAVINRRFSIEIILDGKYVISFPSQTNCRRLLNIN